MALRVAWRGVVWRRNLTDGSRLYCTLKEEAPGDDDKAIAEVMRGGES